MQFFSSIQKETSKRGTLQPSGSKDTALKKSSGAIFRSFTHQKTLPVESPKNSCELRPKQAAAKMWATDCARTDRDSGRMSSLLQSETQTALFSDLQKSPETQAIAMPPK